jgi:hypothetical protein
MRSNSLASGSRDHVLGRLSVEDVHKKDTWLLTQEMEMFSGAAEKDQQAHKHSGS